MRGRNVTCALLPFLLSLAALICLLLVLLAGITNHTFDMFAVHTKSLSISSSEAANLANIISRRDEVRASPKIEHPAPPASLERRIDLPSLLKEASSVIPSVATMTGANAVASAVSSIAANNPAISSLASSAESIASGNNITAKDLGLADSYRIYLWNYCAMTGDDKICTKRGFDWAAKATQISKLEETAKSIGVTIDLPKDLTSALKTFSTVHKWTQAVYLVAAVATGVTVLLGLSLLLGNLSNTWTSRAFPCLTHIISWTSTISLLTASILATVLTIVSTKALTTTTKAYGVTGNINTAFLTTTWLSFIFALAATLLWAFACCCHSKRDSKKGYTGMTEKFGRSKHLDDEEAERLKPVEHNSPHATSPSPHMGGYNPYVDQTPQMDDGYAPKASGASQYALVGGGAESGYGHTANEYPMQTGTAAQRSPGMFKGMGVGVGQQRSNTGQGYEGYRHQGI